MVLVASSLLSHVRENVEVCRCIIDHWVGFCLFFQVPKLSSLTVILKALLLELVLDELGPWLVKHIVLPVLRVDCVLNALVVVHESDAFYGMLGMAWRERDLASCVEAIWIGCLDCSPIVRGWGVERSSSCVLILDGLLVDVRIAWLDRDDLFLESIVEERVPVQSCVEDLIDFLVVDAGEVLDRGCGRDEVLVRLPSAQRVQSLDRLQDSCVLII